MPATKFESEDTEGSDLSYESSFDGTVEKPGQDGILFSNNKSFWITFIAFSQKKKLPLLIFNL